MLQFPPCEARKGKVYPSGKVDAMIKVSLSEIASGKIPGTPKNPGKIEASTPFVPVFGPFAVGEHRGGPDFSAKPAHPSDHPKGPGSARSQRLDWGADLPASRLPQGPRPAKPGLLAKPPKIF